MSAPATSKNNNTRDAAPKPSLLAKSLVSFIGISRTVAGIGCLLAPMATAKILGFSTLSPEAALLTRMFGVREIVIGEGLLLAEKLVSTQRESAHSQPAQQQLSRAIWGNVLTDGLDIVAVLLTMGFGVAEGLPLRIMSAIAGLFVVMGFEAAWVYN